MTSAVLQPDGGFLDAEPSVLAMQALAQEAGATIRTGERVTAIEPGAAGVRIVTDRAVIEARAVIVAAGPWTRSLLPELTAPLRVTRQVMGWFEPADATRFSDFPVFLIESRHGIHYGFPPDARGRIKVARHPHSDSVADPEDYDRTVSPTDESVIRAVLADHIPAANGPRLDATTCLYTMTPEGDFLIDRLPGAPQVIVASPCSGHGFKFAPAIGEILAELATKGETRHDISRFTLARFG